MSDDYTPDDIIGIFMYGQQRLRVTDAGLHPDNDPDDLQTMGALSVLVYRIVSRGETPRDLALSRLAVLTGGLLLSRSLGSGKEIVRKWLSAKAELLELELPMG